MLAPQVAPVGQNQTFGSALVWLICGALAINVAACST